jgi:hypothetical protein
MILALLTFKIITAGTIAMHVISCGGIVIVCVVIVGGHIQTVRLNVMKVISNLPKLNDLKK